LHALISVQRDKWESIDAYFFSPFYKQGPDIVRNVSHTVGVSVQAVCPTLSAKSSPHGAPPMVDWDEWEQRVIQLM
jgi:hypothetical protein